MRILKIEFEKRILLVKRTLSVVAELQIFIFLCFEVDNERMTNEMKQ